MLTSQRILLLVGTLLVSLVVWVLMLLAPMPQGLASPHARIKELAGQGSCESCHASEGLAAGCLSCHAEIKEQLANKQGYHAHLLAGRDVTCGGCHKEHAGVDFQLVSLESWRSQVPRAFKHPHVEFGLEGKHSKLICEDCHEEHLGEQFHLPKFPTTPRPQTFLGLNQDCRSCHVDRHSEGLTPLCSKCHGQEAFKPPVHFDHSLHMPLLGGHTGLECKSCHELPPPGTARRDYPFPFDKSRGKKCSECHQKPHHTQAIENCEDCHAPTAPHWPDAIAQVNADKHAITGFRLLGAHAAVDCAGCHPQELAFQERYQNPAIVGYKRFEDTCEGCHRDVHKGQFEGRHTQCLDCHNRHNFMPSTFGHQIHAQKYELLGAHAAVACVQCHKPDATLETRRFAGTSHACKDCHAYPHGAQFEKEISSGDCTLCHSSQIDHFRIRPFDHAARTGYALVDAHSRALCHDCHIELPEDNGVVARRFRGTSQQCGSCHRDIHRGQFEENGTVNCSSCHRSFVSWSNLSFDHNSMSRFPLAGAHATVACARCHQPVALPDGEVIQYKPLGIRCQDCHEVVPNSNPTVTR